MRRVPSTRSAVFAASVAFVLVVMFIFGFAAATAGRQTVLDDERFGPNSAYFYFQRVHLPPAHARPLSLSPFGASFKNPDRQPAARPGMVATQLGELDLKSP